MPEIAAKTLVALMMSATVDHIVISCRHVHTARNTQPSMEQPHHERVESSPQ